MEDEEIRNDFYVYFWVLAKSFTFVRVPIDIELYTDINSLINHVASHLGVPNNTDVFFMEYVAQSEDKKGKRRSDSNAVSDIREKRSQKSEADNTKEEKVAKMRKLEDLSQIRNNRHYIFVKQGMGEKAIPKFLNSETYFKFVRKMFKQWDFLMENMKCSSPLALFDENGEISEELYDLCDLFNEQLDIQ
ncbi:hypothetical protein TVAG_299270 [Trichomonas vaginalis G3]|uniref:Uncharacterized protein n=1 Tax=Trichomonas vaginalis (strain ATCC PRA-98 / G3) TaxID=412133 RepID=A2EVQ4_TRIV3|nr:hypothetical protein TVAGG3_0414420 [Trichomonas vaginalis G3]EAY03264.1 hypothetical protein TVAG_299270 [Trichomonas vaginalis G3]KAI5535583.1 hypothetical protein TVAGG3_0414420 [Trichomonas vaginalis G3]|eukprot:XP_001315487.1 hypothetical protein [Trichomonas vaginalis G3]